MEIQINDTYKQNTALIKVIQQYEEYCAVIGRRLSPSYNAFMAEKDPAEKEKLKKVYMKELRKLTVDSKSYNNLVQKVTKVLAEVNQQALDVVNGEMADIYAINYNQVAVDCRKAGIEVDG